MMSKVTQFQLHWVENPQKLSCHDLCHQLIETEPASFLIQCAFVYRIINLEKKTMSPYHPSYNWCVVLSV